MIYGKIANLAEYAFLPKAIGDCFAYLQTHDFQKLQPGRHDIADDDIYVNLSIYTTTSAQERFWEAHRTYLDVHVMIEGTEQIDLNFISNMEQHAYEADKDFLPLDGDACAHVLLQPGDFLICYPNDAHRTAIAPDTPSTVKKAIFKIRL